MLPMARAQTDQPAQVEMVDCWGETVVRQFPNRLAAEAFVAVLPEGQAMGLHLCGVNLALIRQAQVVPAHPESN